MDSTYWYSHCRIFLLAEAGMPLFTAKSLTSSSLGHRRGKHKIIKLLIISIQDIIFSALPLLIAGVDIDDFLANLHYGVHIVSIDDGCDIILASNTLDKVINNDTCLRVET